MKHLLKMLVEQLNRGSSTLAQSFLCLCYPFIARLAHGKFRTATTKIRFIAIPPSSDFALGDSLGLTVSTTQLPAS
jgi:hypothetical protein